MGVNLIHLNSKLAILFVFIFAISTPIGILSGIFFFKKFSAMIETIFLAMAAGTFFYVGTNEISFRGQSKLDKMLYFGLGIVLICGLLTLEHYFLQ